MTQTLFHWALLTVVFAILIGGKPWIFPQKGQLLLRHHFIQQVSQPVPKQTSDHPSTHPQKPLRPRSIPGSARSAVHR